VLLDALEVCEARLREEGLPAQVHTIVITWDDGRKAAENSIADAREVLRPQPRPKSVSGSVGHPDAATASISASGNQFTVSTRAQDKDLAERLIDAAKSVLREAAPAIPTSMPTGPWVRLPEVSREQPAQLEYQALSGERITATLLNTTPAKRSRVGKWQ
jgi:hypothetical protein